ncbi:MAG: gas vesicle protein GvpD [archaeon]|nr:gas vesicle protein GvpD [archaeon]
MVKKIIKKSKGNSIKVKKKEDKSEKKKIAILPKLNKIEAKTKDKKPIKFDMASIKSQIEAELKGGKLKSHEAQILEQRAPAAHILNLKEKERKINKNYVDTGIPGVDELFEKGIPVGSTVLVSGGAGSGKTIFCLQTMAYHSKKGDKCFYMSFEENEDRLKQHMKDFGWDADKLVKSGNLKILRYSPFEITRSVDALLAKEKGELLIDIDPIIIPKGFNPDFIVIDSLTAVASAFSVKEDSYRIYIENLFRFFEKLKSTVFLITETKQIPEIFSSSGSEEFLADGVIVLYNIKKGDIRESALEILKMRGTKHQKKIVAMQITDEGIVVYPEQEVFGGIE